ncbi:MAG: glutamate--tRNA ligase [Pseudomonadota bacterium]
MTAKSAKSAQTAKTGKSGTSPKPVTLRFAPSPTGRLHVGNIRPAVLNFMFARAHGGTFILRMDDTDQERSTEAFAQGIRDDLTWLGLTWDRQEYQSARFDRYDAVTADLKARGLLYPCYESADDLERKRKRQRARGLPPVYDRAALALSDADREALEAEGHKPHWRFKLANNRDGNEAGAPAPVTWDDLVRGPQSIDVGSVSDPVFIRADGSYLYTLTSVIDDIDFEITHIIRGEDHVTNAAVQVQLFEALGASAPVFAHHSLLVGADGQGLSKRLGSLSIAGMREAGLEPMAVLSHAALIGTSDAIQPFSDLAGLIANFDIAKLGRAPAKFDMAELEKLNAKWLHAASFEDVQPLLAARGLTCDEQLWRTAQPNLNTLDDLSEWVRVTTGTIEPRIEDEAYCALAAKHLPDAPFDEGTWGVWTGLLKAETDRKGRALFQPLRQALTGEDRGPEMAALLPLIGRERALKRLSGQAG